MSCKRTKYRSFPLRSFIYSFFFIPLIIPENHRNPCLIPFPLRRLRKIRGRNTPRIAAHLFRQEEMEEKQHKRQKHRNKMYRFYFKNCR